jgi:hypothetical protein
VAEIARAGFAIGYEYFSTRNCVAAANLITDLAVIF